MLPPGVVSGRLFHVMPGWAAWFRQNIKNACRKKVPPPASQRIQTGEFFYLWQHRTIPALRLKHRSGGCGTASALPKCSIMLGCGTRIVLRGQKPLALCDRCPCFGSLFPPLAALTFAASSIICAFGLASAAPRSPYRHLELCGIALRILNDTTKKHRTKICLVLFGAPAGIRIPDTLIKRAHRAEHSDFRSFEFSLFLCKAS